MELSAIAWTAILLILVILSLTFTPSCSIAFVILLGRIARAIYRNRMTTEEPSQAHLGDPRAHPRDPPCDRQGDPQAHLGNGPGEARPGDGRPGYPWAPLRDYLIQFQAFVLNALVPAVDAPGPVDAPAPAVDALVGAPALAVDAAGKKRRKPESSSTSSSSSGIKYEVYLNFRGSDTHTTITDHLYRALIDAGISVFKDEEELYVGEEISSEIKETINQARVTIAILSTDFASSRSCLNGLEHMWVRKNLNEQTIIPIFYGISRSDVKFQAGNCGRAFDLHKAAGVDTKTIEIWRQILREIEGLPGYSENLYKGSQAELVGDVVVRVAQILRDDGLVVTDKLFGIDDHVQEMMRRLGVAYSEGQATKVCGEAVRVVGICGVPGVGKTTLAKVVFNKICNLFDACSFLPSISSKQVQFSRRMLMADLQIEKPAPLESSNEGIEETANLSRHAKVLIVLDDVDEDEQIKALAGKLAQFGPGSRIIVTTNESMVLNAFDVGAYDRETVEEYAVEPMSDDHALQLFCEHAFQGGTPEDVFGYFSLSIASVNSIGGLPSDIVRHASSLRDVMNIYTWESTLKSLREHPKDGQAASQVNYAGGSKLRRRSPVPAYLPLGASSPAGGAPPPAGDASPPADPPPPGDTLPPAGPPPADSPAPAGKKTKKLESSSTLSSLSRFEYQVYLHFRGLDTRHGIVDYLYKHLEDSRIRVCMNNAELTPGNEIGPEAAIKLSRISIAIFSRSFASSTSCLRALLQMWECRQTNGQTIIPIYYDVDPDDVALRTSLYRDALLEHESRNPDSVEKWRRVLIQIAGLKGFIQRNRNEGDGQLAKEVVEVVLQLLKEDYRYADDKLVGVDHHVQGMMKKLGVAYREGRAIEVQGEDVRGVEIWGKQGVGKTTLAKAVFYKMRKLFDAHCFLEIRSEGVQSSRRKLIDDLKKQMPAPHESSSEETEEIASLCHDAKVLIVLDGVDKDEQIEALVGKLTWFGPGSRIIVTTNKKNVFKAFDIAAVEEHTVKPMDQRHAHKLFCLHAFQGDAARDVSEYFGLSLDIAEAIGGLPSEIVRQASYLREDMNMTRWKTTLGLLQKKPKSMKEPRTFQVSYWEGSERESSI